MTSLLRKLWGNGTPAELALEREEEYANKRARINPPNVHGHQLLLTTHQEAVRANVTAVIQKYPWSDNQKHQPAILTAA